MNRAAFRRASDVPVGSVRWLLRGRIPRAGLSLLEGKGGLGKSTLAADIAARVSRGAPMPGETDGQPPRAVIYLASEDSTSAVVVPRLLAAGADLELVHVRDDDADRWTTASGAAELEALIRETNAALVILDALKDHTLGDDNAERDVRDALRPLVVIAKRTGVAILGIRHWTKATRESSARGAGSTAYRDVARSVLQLGERPDGQGLALAHGKANYSARAPTMAVHIECGSDGFPQIRWGAELAGVSADDLALHSPEIRVASKGDAAAAALAALLAAEGPMSSDEVKRRVAEETGASERAIQRAMTAAGAKVERRGFGSATEVLWYLPGHGAASVTPRVGVGATGGTERRLVSGNDLAVAPPAGHGATAKTASQQQQRHVLAVAPIPCTGGDGPSAPVGPGEQDDGCGPLPPDAIGRQGELL